MALPQVQVSSQLMQNYRLATPFMNDAQIAVVGGTADTSTIFSVGSNGHLYMLTPDPGSDTGWSQLDLNTSGLAFAGSVRLIDVVADASGTIHLAAVVRTPDDPTSDSIYYVDNFEPSPKFDRWGFRGRSSGTNIAAVSIGLDATQQPAVVIATVEAATGQQALAAVDVTPRTPAAPWTPVTPSNPPKQCLAVAVAARAGVGGVYASYIDQGGTPRLEFIGLSTPQSVDLAHDRTYNELALAAGPDGAPNLFASAGGAIYYADPNTGLTALGAVPGAIGHLVAARNPGSTFDVYALTTDAKLYHAVQGRQDPYEILTRVAHLAADDSADGSQSLFFVAYDNTLQWATRDLQTSDWSQAEIEVVVDRQVESYQAYSTVLAFTDAAGAPALYTPVQITSSTLASVYVNGESYVVDATTPLACATNGAGQVVLNATTDRLATATLSITADFLPGDHSVELQQNADIQGRLETITADQLLQATKADGTKLLQGKYANADVAASLQKALNNTMSLAKNPPPAGNGASPAALDVRNHNTAAARYRAAAPALLGAIDHASVPVQHWELDRTSGLPIFRDHTADSIAGPLAAPVDTVRLQATAAALTSSGHSSWGDLWEAIKSGAIELGKLFVSTIIDPITKLVKEIAVKIEDFVGNVRWNGAVALVEQIYDVAEGIFQTVEVFFEDLFDWLGFLFNWDDILRTKDTITYAFNQFVPYIQGALEYAKTQAIAGINTLEGQIAQVFDSAVAQLGVQTIGGKQQSDAPPQSDVSSTNVHNIFYTGFVNNANGAPAPAGGGRSLVSQDVLSALEGLIARLTTYAQDFQSAQAFTNAIDYFSQIKDNPDRFLQLVLGGMLEIFEGIALLGLDVAKTVLGLLIDGIIAVLGAVLATLNEPWDIPFLSDLYSAITKGGTLTTLDVMALIIAIPGTVLYKVLYNAAPFPDDATRQTFESGFTTPALLRLSGMASAPRLALATADAAEGPASAPAEPSPFKPIFNVFGIVNQFFYGAFEAIIDIIPPDDVAGGFQIASINPRFQKIRDQTVDGIGALSVAVWVMEWTGQLFTIPWIAGDGGGVGCDDDTKLGNLIWILQNLGAGYDTVWYFVTAQGGHGRIARNAGDIGVIVDSAYGCCHLGLQFWWAFANGWKDGATISQNFFGALVEACKILRWTRVIVATEGFSLPAMSAVDLIGDEAVAFIGIGKLATA